MLVLMGFAALAADVGILWSEKRQMQTAADAAAIAAATALRNGGSMNSAADDVAALNGFSNGANGVVVTVNNPPASGVEAGNSGFVEIIVSQPEPTYFMRVLGYASVKVSARAVGGAIGGPACIYALNPSAPDAISFTGNISVDAACGIIDDSSSSSAMTGTGNGTVSASSIGVAGDYSSTGSMTFVPTPQIHVAPAPDPFASLAPPTVGTVIQAGVTNSGAYVVSGNNETVTIPPGVYKNGISVSGNNASVTFSSGTYGNNINIGGNTASAVFNPGQYQNGGGSGDSVDIAGNATTTFNPGSYAFAGAVRITGNNTVTLSPGLYEGGITITGNANVTFSPGVYILAGGGLKVTGNSTLDGSGVTFYDTSGLGGYQPIVLSGNETANLSAPTSGPLEAMLFFQDRSVPEGSPGSVVVGNATSNFDGVVYFPTTSVTYTGNSGGGYTVLVADTIAVTGNASMTIGNNYSSLADGSPIKSSALYE